MAEVRWFSFHNVKHLTASRLDACGVPLRTIKALLRHQATTMTSRYLDSLTQVYGKRSQFKKILGKFTCFLAITY